jgi:tight adherence protein B
MLIILIATLVFAAVALFVYGGIPFIVRTMVETNQRRAKDFARTMDRTMVQADIQKVSMLILIGPVVGAVLGLLFLKLPGAILGAVVGFLLPKTYAGMLIARHKKQFDNQLIDALMIMSSSFRGGLSLIQSMEAVAEEMPDPIRQEFGIVLGENKMGVTLDEALNRMYKRMPSPSLQQVVSAVLLARETGGNLPLIFSRIVTTIRERKKIEENLHVLTLQGKLQAVVMSGLPVAFFLMVSSTNPKYFNLMLSAPMGRTMLMICLGLWLVGTFMIIRISSFKDF